MIENDAEGKHRRVLRQRRVSPLFLERTMDFMTVLRAGAQTSILFGVGIIFPVVGQIATFLTPVPVILAAIRRGMREALAALVLASLLIAGLAGTQAAVILFGGFGLMALGIAVGMRKGMTAERAILLGGIAPVIAGAAPLAYVALHSSAGIIAPVEQYIRSSIQTAVQVYREIGLAETAEAVNAVSDRFIYYFVRLLPGITISLSLAQSAFCFGIARARLLRRPEQSTVLQPYPAFAAWHAPDAWVWGLIAALACIAVPTEAVRIAGINVGIVYFLVYSAQGMAIADFVLRRAGLNAVVRGVLHAVIVALPSVLLLPPIGIMDIWTDVRKLRKTAHSTSDKTR